MTKHLWKSGFSLEKFNRKLKQCGVVYFKSSHAFLYYCINTSVKWSRLKKRVPWFRYSIGSHKWRTVESLLHTSYGSIMKGLLLKWYCLCMVAVKYSPTIGYLIVVYYFFRRVTWKAKVLRSTFSLNLFNGVLCERDSFVFMQSWTSSPYHFLFSNSNLQLEIIILWLTLFRFLFSSRC